MRLETTACDGGGVGSGFLISPTLVATVAHVSQRARSTSGSRHSGATNGRIPERV